MRVAKVLVVSLLEEPGQEAHVWDGSSWIGGPQPGRARDRGRKVFFLIGGHMGS